MAILYVVLSITNFVAIAIDNISVLSLLELSSEFTNNENSNSETLLSLGPIFYKIHWWTHYMSLLISCFPVFVLYCTLYLSRLIPRALSVFGIVAVTLMFVQMLSSILGHGISANLMIPMGLIQLTLPIYLIVKGLKSVPMQERPDAVS